MQNKYKILNIGLIAFAAGPIVIAHTVLINMLWVVWPELEKEQCYRVISGLAIVAIPAILSSFAAFRYLRIQSLLPRRIVVALTLAILACGYTFLNFAAPHLGVRNWMLDQDTYLMLVFCGLIPHFYYLLCYAAAVLGIHNRKSLILSIIATIALPVLLYLAFNLLRFMPGLSSSGHAWQLVSIALTSAFSFFVIRIAAYLLGQNREALQKPKAMRIIRLVFLGALPLLGLFVNRSGPLGRESQAVLGNFTHPVFWYLAALNAILYLLPDFRLRPLQYAAAALRAAGFIFVLYFCTVFLFYLPLALVLIVVFGVGLLLLIPYAAAAIQLQRLRRDYTLLRDYGRAKVWLAFLAGVTILPGSILAHIYYDRAHLTRAIDFAERPPLGLEHKGFNIDEKILTLTEAGANNRGRGFRHDRHHIPIYDAIYREVVLDGAELAEGLRQKLRRIFSGERFGSRNLPAPGEDTATIAAVKVESKPGELVTESTLAVRVENTGPRDAEFSTRLELGDGAFVSGHWLTIDGVEVPAQVVSRNAAIFVFNRIVEARRDPSLIYFEGKDRLRWRIFPVPASGFREAKIRIAHRYDTEVKLGHRVVRLKAGSATAEALFSSSGSTHLIGAASPDFEIRRRPYLHFIADCSLHAGKDYAKSAKAVARKLGLSLEDAKVSFVNTAIRTADFNPDSMRCPDQRRGFFAEMAIRAVMDFQFHHPGASFPVIAVLSPDRLALLAADLSYMTALYGDANGFAWHDGTKLGAYDFFGDPMAIGKLRLGLPVRLYGGKYYAASSHIALSAPVQQSAAAHQRQGALLDGIEKFQAGERAGAVLAAMDTNILNPAAGSIVLETEAQRRKLAEINRKRLHARNQPDTGEVQRMSEPLVFFLIGLVFIALGLWRRRVEQKRISWFDEEP